MPAAATRQSNESFWIEAFRKLDCSRSRIWALIALAVADCKEDFPRWSATEFYVWILSHRISCLRSESNIKKYLRAGRFLRDQGCTPLTIAPATLQECIQQAKYSATAADRWKITMESYEWWTPLPLLALVHSVLGHIDTDPASCALANQRVKAKNFFTESDDGLSKEWKGRVFCNPPGKQRILIVRWKRWHSQQG